MGFIDYSLEPRSDIAFVDIKSFYASVECVKRKLDPLSTSLCVMSRSENSSGLILASSPLFKMVFGKNNVGRARDLPFDIETRKFSFEKARHQNVEITKSYIDYIEKWAKNTLIVPPRMALYIEENLKIQRVFQNYAAKEEILPYSIDEGFIDLTKSLSYFVPNKSISRRDKLDLVSSMIQREIWESMGLYSTVGMSNANPLLAKLALDNEAKKTRTMRANWSYEDVETKLWGIDELTDFWGIGSRMKKRLNDLYIFSVKDLANYNPDILKKELGVIGLQLWFHANGVDESKSLSPTSLSPRALAILKCFLVTILVNMKLKLFYVKLLSRSPLESEESRRRLLLFLFMLVFLTVRIKNPSMQGGLFLQVSPLEFCVARF